MLLQLLCCVVLCNLEFLQALTWTLKHSVGHNSFHNRTQATSAELILYSLIDYIFQRLSCERQFYLIHLEELDILTHDGVLWLNENPAKGIPVEWVEIGKHRQTTDDLRNKAERLQVLWLHVFHHLLLVNLTHVLHGVIANGMRVLAALRLLHESPNLLAG